MSPQIGATPSGVMPRTRTPFTLTSGEVEVRFYAANAKYGELSNLYRRAVVFDGREFATAEHAYQFAKARDPRVRDWLMAAPSPALLAKAAHQLTRPWEVSPGWSRAKVDRMRRVLHAKFTQHDDLRKILLGTRDADLVEWGTIDDDAGRFWGRIQAADGSIHGKNTLGTLLMELRASLRPA